MLCVVLNDYTVNLHGFTKAIEAEVAKILAMLRDLSSSRSSAAIATARERLSALQSRFATVKKFTSSRLSLLRARLSAPAPSLLPRLFLSDLLSRHSDAGAALASKWGLSPLLDSSAHALLRRLIAALRAGDTRPAIDWALRYLPLLQPQAHADLLFELHFVAFAELAREGKPAEAVALARKELRGGREDQRRRVRAELARLCDDGDGGDDDERERRRREREKERDAAVALVRAAFCGALGMPEVPPWRAAVASGVCVLRAAGCEDGRAGARCAVCGEAWRGVRQMVPKVGRARSRVRCAATGKVADEVAVLPSGRVFAPEALVRGIDAEKGKVKCPVTGEEFELSEVRKAILI